MYAWNYIYIKKPTLLTLTPVGECIGFNQFKIIAQAQNIQNEKKIVLTQDYFSN